MLYENNGHLTTIPYDHRPQVSIDVIIETTFCARKRLVIGTEAVKDDNGSFEMTSTGIFRSKCNSTTLSQKLNPI